MNLAHSGIQHATNAEAAAHSWPMVLLTVVLVTLTVAAFVAGSLYVLSRFSIIKFPSKGIK